MNKDTEYTPSQNNEQSNYPSLELSSPVPEPHHITFAAKSPSIIPTPMYDDTSSFYMSPQTSKLPSSSLTSQSQDQPPMVLMETKTNTYEDKLQTEEDKNIYGPTFREEEAQRYNSPPSTSLLTQGFTPSANINDEEIQLYETSSRVPLNHNIPPPEQNRVDIFMNKLKGRYQKPADSNDFENQQIQGEEMNRNRELNQYRTPKQRGLLFRQLFGNAQYPIFTWASAAIMVGVFIYEIIRNHQLSGSWIQTNPFNPMIGPNYMALVTMGSKFVPCMRAITQYSPTTLLGNCYSSLEATCTIEQVCGFGEFHGEEPHQSFRFFTPIFLHAGVIHILMNLITHFQIGSDAERDLGLIRYMILYLSSGIWGFILSGVLAGTTISSMGCSGALFGLVGYTVVDLIMSWKQVTKPGRELVKLLLVIIISLVLGLLPGLDNFAHIGGLIMGLLVSTLLKSKHQYASRYSMIITWIVRIVSFILIIVLFVVFLRIFYTATDLSTVCPGCKYLSCLPVNGWCDI